MNRLSKESIIKNSTDPNRTSKMLREMDFDGFQLYISIIENTKQEIKRTKRWLVVMNVVAVSLFIPGAILSFRSQIVSQLIWLGPLLLTCIIFIIALCRIRNTIRSIRIAQSNERLTMIHFFNIVTFTLLAFTTRYFLWRSDS